MSFCKLPNETIVLIFKKSNDLNELLKFRLINKRCNELVKSIKIYKMAIEQNHLNKQNYLRKIYSFSNELISSSSVLFRNGVHMTNYFDFMSLNFMKLMLAKLKQLSIDCLFINLKLKMSKFESLINELKELEHLQINCLKTIQKKQIKFDYLKVFSVLQYSGSELLVDAPNLTKLAWYADWNKIELVHKHTITHLTINCIAIESLPVQFSAIEFSSVEYLDVKYFVGDHKRLFENQSSLLNLKQLNIRKIDFKELAIIILKRKQFQATNLDLFYYGIEMNDLNDVEKLFGNDKMILKLGTDFVTNNYRTISKVYKINEPVEINYSRLVDHFGELRIPVNELCSKFVNIRSVCDSSSSCDGKLINQDAFINFIKRCFKSLDELVIIKTPFNQQFYNDLHLNCPFIKCLKIKEPNGLIENFRFLIELNELTELSIYRELNLETIQLLINRDLNSKFLLDNKMISIDLVNCNIKYSGCQYSNFDTNYKILNFIQQIFNYNLEIDMFKMKL